MAELTEQEAALLSSDINEEALFGGAFDELFGGVVVETDEASAAVLDEEELLATFHFGAWAGEPLEESVRRVAFLLVKLEEGVNPAGAIRSSFNAILRTERHRCDGVGLAVRRRGGRVVGEQAPRRCSTSSCW